MGTESGKEKEISVCFPCVLLSQSEVDDFPSNINASFQPILNHQICNNKFIMNMKNINKRDNWWTSNCKEFLRRKKEARKSRLKIENCPKMQITEDDRKRGD